MTPETETERPGAGLFRALNLRDVVLMNVVAVVGLRWIARGARTGPASVTLWILAWVAFFIPLAVACAMVSIICSGSSNGKSVS